MFRHIVQRSTRTACTMTTNTLSLPFRSTTTTSKRQISQYNSLRIVQRKDTTQVRNNKRYGVLVTGGTSAAAWTFSNSTSFEQDLAKDIQTTQDKVQPPQQPTVFSGDEGLQTESFGSWIRAILSQLGHFDINNSQVQSDIATYSPHHEDIDDEIDRAHLEPETFLWCKDYLNQIFRFSNHEGMSSEYEIALPVADKLEDYPLFNSNDELLNELIKFKTFIEKERYKYFRVYEEITEHTAELSQSLDMMNVALAQVNPFDNKMERYISSTLAPIYKSVHNSLLSVIDLSVILDKPLLHAQSFDEKIQNVYDEKLLGTVATMFPMDKTTWDNDHHTAYQKLEYAVYSRMLHMLKQEAIALQQANTVLGSLQQLYHELSWDFKTYYDPKKYERIITLAQKEGDKSLSKEEKDEYFSTQNQLPIPPLFELNSTNVINLFVHQQNLKELNQQLKDEFDQQQLQAQQNGNASDNSLFDPQRITVVSQPVTLMFKLVNADKQTIIPTIHHRSIVYHEFMDMIQRVRQRPYILHGLQQRMFDIVQQSKTNPTTTATTQHNVDDDIENLRKSYIHSAKEQKHKKNSKKDRAKLRKRRHEKKLAKMNAAASNTSGSDGFENFDSHRYHPDHDDAHRLEDEEKESVENALEEALHLQPLAVQQANLSPVMIPITPQSVINVDTPITDDVNQQPAAPVSKGWFW